MKLVEIYTDGACSGNPGVGGWAAILMYKDTRKEISGAEAETTNNRMEMTAVIKAFEMLKEKCRVKLYSDSAYVINAFLEGWTEQWSKNEWRALSGGKIKNIDLWEKLLGLEGKHSVEWIKVKGHSDNENNNRCDLLARTAIKKEQ